MAQLRARSVLVGHGQHKCVRFSSNISCRDIRRTESVGDREESCE